MIDAQIQTLQALIVRVREAFEGRREEGISLYEDLSKTYAAFIEGLEQLPIENLRVHQKLLESLAQEIDSLKAYVSKELSEMRQAHEQRAVAAKAQSAYKSQRRPFYGRG